MAKLKIYTYPEKVLAQKAAPIQRVEKSFFKLADDMLETMYDAPGIGLAANQVGILQRFLVVDVDYDLDDWDGKSPPPENAEVVGTSIFSNKKPIILINPKIVQFEGTASIQEGCLSVPEFRAEVDRHEKIKVEYLNLDGLTKTLSADGLLAIAIQHEMDHLDGKLFIDHLSPLKRELAQKKVIKWLRDQD